MVDASSTIHIIIIIILPLITTHHSSSLIGCFMNLNAALILLSFHFLLFHHMPQVRKRRPWKTGHTQHPD